MQRTSELFSAPPATPLLEVPENEAVASTDVALESAERPRFASIHTLLMRVDSLRDVGSGSVWVRDVDGILQHTTTDKIPTNRMAQFLADIADGKVYALWGHRYLEFDELGPEWPYAQQKLANQLLTPTSAVGPPSSLGGRGQGMEAGEQGGEAQQP
jgi:hypothetical protein